MVLDALLENEPQWLSQDGPEGAITVMSQCTLNRNFSDFSFPNRCSEEEKTLIQDRVLSVLDNLNLLSTGHYFSLQELSAAEIRFLAERQLITYDLLCARDSRGVYVAEDQCLSIMVNGEDHLSIRAMIAGNQFNEIWARVNLLDDTLGGAFDFAFDDRLGFLTSSLGSVGTGLFAGALLHLPASLEGGGINDLVYRAHKQGLRLQGVHAGPDVNSGKAAEAGQSIFSDSRGPLSCHVSDTIGDLYLLINESTLGYSEEEIVFRVAHTATDIMKTETQVRAEQMNDYACSIEDRVGRARGNAAGARILEFTEGLSLLSSLRLGVDVGVLADLGLDKLNRLMLASQQGQIEAALGDVVDMKELRTKRATLFRDMIMQIA